ncbi:hypothetical protein ZWY2020_011160 [Hordeum vulgare]|nr:hypothetical protein ZWY2020_011160 [Hordeum vulgare]
MRSRSSPSPARCHRRLHGLPPLHAPAPRRFFVGRLFDYAAPASDFRRLSQLSSWTLGVGHQVLAVAMSPLFCVALYCVLACSSIGAHMFTGGLIGFIWIQSGWIRHDSGHHRSCNIPKL